MKYPTVIATSVIRSTHQGDSHGGVYLIDLNGETVRQVIDWDDASINWEGRGGDRGLRGIAFHDGLVYIAASDEIFIYTPDFVQVETIRNRYLRHCHEIFIVDDKLYLTATGFDSILVYDLRGKRFVQGYTVRYGGVKKRLAQLRQRVMPAMSVFDPHGEQGPFSADTTHINNIFVKDDNIYLSGTAMGVALRIHDNQLSRFANIPYGTHNTRPFKDELLLNDTLGERIVRLRDNDLIATYPLPQYRDDQLLQNNLPQDHAKQAFGRGLCVWGDYLIGGSSPATVSIYHLSEAWAVKHVNITMDVRNAIHGLEVWPF